MFIASRHDTGIKTFFGTAKNWDGPDIINEILRDNPGKRAIAARFIARKVWESFAYPGPESWVLDDLQNALLATDLDLRSLLRTMFNRPEFYSTAAKQGLTRTPTEFAVALCSATSTPAKDLSLVSRGEAMGQQLLDPPNVAGWKANAYWLTTSALSARAVLARDVAARLVKANVFANLPNLSVQQAVDAVLAYFRLSDVSASTAAALVNGYHAERTVPKSSAATATTNLLISTMLTPEMHAA